MKKLTSLYAMLLMAMMAVTFTSCETDEEYEADTLAGAWEGNMKVVVYDDYGYEYVSTRSVIYFNRDPYSYASGVGYQIDYFEYSSPWYHDRSRDYYLATHFEWEVEAENGPNGEKVKFIKIYYGNGQYAEISDYELSYNYFHGFIDYEDGSSSEFWLSKTSSPNDYERYYEWEYDDYYYYGKENSLEFEDSTRAAGSAGTKPMKIYRTAKRANSVEK